MLPVKIGFLISYDYSLLNFSLPLVYYEADEIIIAIDKKRLTWAGNPFNIDTDFFTRLKELDNRNIIKIYEDEFYQEGLSAGECEIQERKMVSNKLGENCWQIQLDADEYFIAFSDFIALLREIESSKRLRKREICVDSRIIPLFKKLDNGILVVSEANEKCYIACNYNNTSGLRNAPAEVKIDTNSYILHHSWARTPEELLFKLQNWGHNNDFKDESYFRFWMSVNETNYGTFNDFHPRTRGKWNKLELLRVNTINELIDHFNLHKQPVSWTIIEYLSFFPRVKRSLKHFLKFS